MSTPTKPDPAAGALFLAKLLAEDEAERIEGLSDEEFLAEQRQKGRDPSRTPTTEAILERVKAKAARQVHGAQERALPATKEAGTVKAVAPVVPIRRLPRILWLVAAAFVVAIVVAAFKGPEIVAQFRGDNDDQDQTPRPADREAAEKLRDDAVGSCEQSAFGACKAKLDEAKRLDPAGESEPRVQKARAAIEKAVRLGPETPNQPGP